MQAIAVAIDKGGAVEAAATRIARRIDPGDPGAADQVRDFAELSLVAAKAHAHPDDGVADDLNSLGITLLPHGLGERLNGGDRRGFDRQNRGAGGGIGHDFAAHGAVGAVARQHGAGQIGYFASIDRGLQAVEALVDHGHHGARTIGAEAGDLAGAQIDGPFALHRPRRRPGALRQLGESNLGVAGEPRLHSLQGQPHVGQVQTQHGHFTRKVSQIAQIKVVDQVTGRHLDLHPPAPVQPVALDEGTRMASYPFKLFQITVLPGLDRLAQVATNTRCRRCRAGMRTCGRRAKRRNE